MLRRSKLDLRSAARANFFRPAAIRVPGDQGSSELALTRRFEISNDPCRITDGDSEVRDRVAHHGTRPNNAARSYGDAGKHDGIVTDPDIRADHNGAWAFLQVHNIGFVAQQGIKLGAALHN